MDDQQKNFVCKEATEKTTNPDLEQENKQRRTIVFNEDLAKQDVMGIRRFNKRTSVWIKNEIKTKLQVENYNESTSFDLLYRIYVGVIGKGNVPILIFVNGYDVLLLGDNELYLQRLQVDADKFYIEFLTEHEDNSEDIIKACEALRIPYTDEKGVVRQRKQLIADLIGMQISKKSIMFKLCTGIPLSELEKIESIPGVVRYALKAGLKKDPLIDYLCSSQIPKVNPQKIRPRNYMPYASHSIMITNPKVGKTSNALRIGELKEKATEANLLGFGTANERVAGALDGATKPFFFDEVQEEKDTEIWGKLHTYMELGETSIGRGRGVKTQGWASISFMGNPKNQQGEYEPQNSTLVVLKRIETLDMFKTLLKKISSNYKAFGSRIAVVLFKENMQSVEGKSVSQEEQEKLQTVLNTIADGYRNAFTDLFHNEDIRSWLHKEFDQEYCHQLQTISKKISSREIADFINGQVQSYRHLRGTALRLAWLDYLSEYIKVKDGSINADKILIYAEEHLQTLQNVNLESFAYVAQMENSEEFGEYLLSLLENLKPTYVRLFIYTFLEWEKKNSDKKIAVFDELADYHASVREKYDVGKYDNFFKTKDPLLNEKEKSNDLLYPFGIKIVEINANIPAAVIEDDSKLKKFSLLYFNKGVGTKRTFGTPIDPFSTKSSQPLAEDNEVQDTKSSFSSSTKDKDDPAYEQGW